MTSRYEIPRYRVQLVREGTVRYTAATPDDAVAILRQELVTERGDRECMAVLYLDGRSRVVGSEVVAMGGMHGMTTTTKEVLRGAIAGCASGIILGHNHPSGSPEPSREDVELTAVIDAGCRAVGIHLLDHVIVTEDAHTSFHERGLLS